MLENQTDFVSYLMEKFPIFKTRIEGIYQVNRYKIRIVYCSRYDFDVSVKTVVDSPKYLDFPVLKYFEKTASTIKLSALPELLAFLDVKIPEIGQAGIIKKQENTDFYHGSILPEEASGLPPGYKVVSFYADANALLQRAYVLRRKGWRSSQQAYQRMIIPSKIEAIREGLKKKGQVSINNIIATLPSDVLAVSSDGHTVNMSTLTETEPVKITLPLRPNTIGLIDGQHRLYSYYKTRNDDQTINKLRNQQNLLVTGIVYPTNLQESESERFEARLFLTINSNQSSASSELRQEIEVLLNPLSTTAISKQVIERLASTGSLVGHVERYFYDKGKLKTSSIVNFGLVPLLKLGGTDSLFCIYPNVDKSSLNEGSSEALEDYIQFCVSRINIFLSAVRSNISNTRWTTDARIKDRMLTVTYINSFLIIMRLLIQSGHSIEFEELKLSLDGFDEFDTSTFSSSQYNRMATKIAKEFFDIGI